MNEDRLDAAWRKAHARVTELEMELEVARNKFQVLDEARALVLADTPSGALAFQKIVPSGAATFQDTVLQYVRNASNESMTPGEVAAALKKLGYGKDRDANTFYSGVYVALRRLVERGEISSVKGDKGLLFSKGVPNQNLFSHLGKESMQ